MRRSRVMPWPMSSPAAGAARLMELTDRRAKPAVYFGGKSRIIDFALSNALNSGIRRMAVATQYKAHSLIRHLQRGWNFFRPERNESFDILPASQRVAEDNGISARPTPCTRTSTSSRVMTRTTSSCSPAITSTKWTYEPMLQQHVGPGRRCDGRLPRSAAQWRPVGFGVMHVDATDRILCFVEKPSDPPAMPGQPDLALASMGIYVFETEFLSSNCVATPPISTIQPRFWQGHHPLHRRRRKAVAHRFSAPACAPRSSGTPIGATSARSTPIGPPISI